MAKSDKLKAKLANISYKLNYLAKLMRSFSNNNCTIIPKMALDTTLYIMLYAWPIASSHTYSYDFLSKHNLKHYIILTSFFTTADIYNLSADNII